MDGAHQTKQGKLRCPLGLQSLEAQLVVKNPPCATPHTFCTLPLPVLPPLIMLPPDTSASFWKNLGSHVSCGISNIELRRFVCSDKLHPLQSIRE